MSCPGSEYRPGGEWAGWRGESRLLAPDAAPNWLRPLVDNADDLSNTSVSGALLKCGGAHKPSHYDFGDGTQESYAQNE